MKKILVMLIAFASLQSKAATDDTWNLRFSPIGLIIGIVNAELDYKLNDSWTVGPSFAVWNIKILDIAIKSSSFGVQSRYFFSGAYTDSAYLVIAGGTTSAKATITSANVDYTGEASGTYIGAGGGYHWFWNSFNMNVAGVLMSTPTSNIELKDSNGNKYSDKANTLSAGLGVEYTLGWTF